MKMPISKQLIKIGDETLLEKCIKNFISFIDKKNILIVSNDKDLATINFLFTVL